MKRHIADEADGRLAFYIPLPADQPPPPPGAEVPPRPQLPDGLVDAPLVRVFNFLRKCTLTRENVLFYTSPISEMMSMSYQLEILWYQAERLRSLGWADYLNVTMTNDRRTLNISYWM